MANTLQDTHMHTQLPSQPSHYVMSLLIARLFIFCRHRRAVVYCSIPALVRVFLRLCRAQLPLWINPLLHMETQHQGHTLSKQVSFIKPRAASLRGAADARCASFQR